jgi:hypothetical protein
MVISLFKGVYRYRNHNIKLGGDFDTIKVRTSAFRGRMIQKLKNVLCKKLKKC